jgi:lipooligosaccharide transport system ATP-binding protein
MPPIISAMGLTKIYGGIKAVDRIDFEIREGECFGFLGPNGAGKTTTMRMIQCAIPKTSGRLLVKGMEVDERPREIKRILGVVPQENNLDPDFTVLKNLTVYARYFDIPKGEAERRALELLRFVQLYERRDSPVDKLSGGMRRRLMLARALINEPEILVMDEPTTGLDPQARHAIWDKIRALKREGVTVVLTTHYMEEASQLCDRLVIMDLGRIIAEGSPAELIEEHVGSEVVEVDNRPEVLGLIAREGERYEMFGDRIHVLARDPKGFVSKLMGACDLERVAIRRATLEDVFLKLTGRALRD